MPEIVLTGDEFEVVDSILEEFASRTSPHPQMGALLSRFSTLKNIHEETRPAVEQARREFRDWFFTFDQEAEVFPIDEDYSWVNGWALVRRKEKEC